MSDTKIDYLTKTWNFFTGCQNHSNGVCPIGSECWAKQMAHRYSRSFEPQLHPEKLLEPLSWKKPQRVGVCFTGDLMGEWVDPCQLIEYPIDNRIADSILLSTIKGVVGSNGKHQFFFLTKNPAGYAKWGKWPDNSYIGATACNTKMFIYAINAFVKIESKHRWLSFEPLMERIQIPSSQTMLYAGINWVVIGGWSTQAQRKAHPIEISWVREIVEAADKAKIPVFLKDNLADLMITSGTFVKADRRWAITDKQELRQELPEAH